MVEGRTGDWRILCEGVVWLRVRHDHELACALARVAGMNVDYFKKSAVELARKLNIKLPTVNRVDE